MNRPYPSGSVSSGAVSTTRSRRHSIRRAGRMLGLDVTYELLPREAAFSTQFDEFLIELGQAGYQGVNITVPFKSSGWRTAPDASDEVATTGVANTVLLGPTGPRRLSTPTSPASSGHTLDTSQIHAPGAVAILGAGGVGTATAAALVDLGATIVHIFDICEDRSHALATTLRERDGSIQANVAGSAEEAVDGVDGVVNGTPVGMYLHPGTPVDLAAIGDQRWIFDAVYSPIETPLMERAAEANLSRISGFDLFLGQAIDAFEIFTDHRLTPDLLVALEAQMRLVERKRHF